MEKVAEAVEELQAAIKDQEACLKRKRETLDEQLDHLFKKPKSKEVKASDVIQLNVGGDTGFVTKRDTLTAVQGSRLAEMFRDRWIHSWQGTARVAFSSTWIPSSFELC
ncbi:unnamed protein product [Effrenium voratum]|uniref:Uncharacterized protein n=1 Tax=Effrenium voratum TaxID=2562239 RepID=A0AA36JC61_9DINO|nr:unnamed protein product [Effrenium voratum]